MIFQATSTWLLSKCSHQPTGPANLSHQHKIGKRDRRYQYGVAVCVRARGNDLRFTPDNQSTSLLMIRAELIPHLENRREEKHGAKDAGLAGTGLVSAMRDRMPGPGCRIAAGIDNNNRSGQTLVMSYPEPCQSGSGTVLDSLYRIQNFVGLVMSQNVSVWFYASSLSSPVWLVLYLNGVSNAVRRRELGTRLLMRLNAVPTAGYKDGSPVERTGNV
ncbi:hypothetical protein Bbelb_385260 [Branchiostoma belcheri]|nr:hypothetical protein Bbelb_385260 [Branchiostoma belcheri]